MLCPPQKDGERSDNCIGFWLLAALNVGVLCVYKYIVPGSYFPLGLSFYTFSQLLYLKSVLIDRKPASGFLSYLEWMLFFGKVTQGPILGYDGIAEFVETKRIGWDSFADAVVLFVFGMAKKLLIADNLAIFADNAWGAENLGLIPTWIGTLSYTFQLYFDFSGYSDMAMAVGLMLGLKIPQNFNSPYKSSSISEFWRRWHITLGKALTELVYIPLGGSRKGRARTCINLVVVMLISGIWHGNSYTFIIWGLLNGLIMVIERLTGLSKRKSVIQTVLCFITVNFLWVFFRAPSLDAALAMIASMFNVGNLGIGGVGALAMDGIINFPDVIDMAYIGFLILLSFVICFCFKNTTEVYTRVRAMRSGLVFLPILFMMCFVSFGRGAVFLYQNF